MNAKEIVDLLNEAAALDPQAINLLIGCRVSCNEKLPSHPTIVCREGDSAMRASLSVLGLLQGLVSVACERIVAVVDDNPTVPIRFVVGTPETYPNAFKQ